MKSFPKATPKWQKSTQNPAPTSGSVTASSGSLPYFNPKVKGWNSTEIEMSAAVWSR